jgi:hypothetical protein
MEAINEWGEAENVEHTLAEMDQQHQQAQAYGESAEGQDAALDEDAG